MRYTPDLGAALVKRTWILVVLPDQAAPVKCASNPALNCKATMKLEHGQVAVVTNVATGMGRSLALQLAAKGVCRRPPTLAPRARVRPWRVSWESLGICLGTCVLSNCPHYLCCFLPFHKIIMFLTVPTIFF